jgi:hypothetical protein
MATLAPSPVPVPVARRPPKGGALLRVVATTDHKLIGILYLVTAFGFFMAGGLVLSGLGTILGAVNMMTTVVCLRAPGMTMFRMPIFTWNILFTSILVLLAFPILAAALLGLLADRRLGAHTGLTRPPGVAVARTWPPSVLCGRRVRRDLPQPDRAGAGRVLPVLGEGRSCGRRPAGWWRSGSHRLIRGRADLLGD